MWWSRPGRLPESHRDSPQRWVMISPHIFHSHLASSRACWEFECCLPIWVLPRMGINHPRCSVHWNPQGKGNIGRLINARRRESETEIYYTGRTFKELQEVATHSWACVNWKWLWGWWRRKGSMSTPIFKLNGSQQQ